MPALNWPDFLRAHYRPHLLVVDLGTKINGVHGRRLARLLGDLVDSLQTSADYAVCSDRQEVKVAFESHLDAAAFGKLLKARLVEGDGKDWASKSVSHLNSRLGVVRRQQEHRKPNRRSA